ncbi:MAG: START domain-containing protein, partial [Mucilaginibacter sp.]
MNKLLLFILLLQFPQPDWKLTTNQADIHIYTGTTAAKQVKPIKVECTLKASPAQLLAVLLDINNYPEWIYHTKSATLVKQVSAQDLYYYSEVNVPWPGENRD